MKAFIIICFIILTISFFSFRSYVINLHLEGKITEEELKDYIVYATVLLAVLFVLLSYLINLNT